MPFWSVLITAPFVRKYDLATPWKRTSAISNEGENKLSTTFAYSRTPCPKVTDTSRRTQTLTTRCCSEDYEPVSHIERLVANTSCRKALQEDLLKYRQKKILEAAQKRRSLKKCRRDLCGYNVPLAALLSEDGTRREMEIITERLHSNLFRSSTPVSSPIIATGEAPPRILHGFESTSRYQ
ncbi:hypothetical protein RB195_011260 [Necator americanus]